MLFAPDIASHKNRTTPNSNPARAGCSRSIAPVSLLVPAGVEISLHAFPGSQEAYHLYNAPDFQPFLTIRHVGAMASTPGQPLGSLWFKCRKFCFLFFFYMLSILYILAAGLMLHDHNSRYFARHIHFALAPIFFTLPPEQLGNNACTH